LIGEANVLKKLLLLSLTAVPAVFAAHAAFGQVASSARGGDSTIWVGGELSNFNPDYDGRENLDGIGAFVDYNITPKLGLEGQMRWLNWHNSQDGRETQSSYMGGVKYRVFHYQRFSVNAKFLLGGVWITYPYFSSEIKISQGNGSYFAFAPAGDVEYRVSRHWAVRGGYEFQFLPSAPGTEIAPNSSGLTPHGFNVGVSYRVLGVR
jgi:opacity protein-like surface antigen